MSQQLWNWMQSTVSLYIVLMQSGSKQAEVRWCQWRVKPTGTIDTSMTDTCKIHSRLWERRITCLVLLKNLSVTTEGLHPPPPWYKNRNQCLKLGWGKMKREASTAMFRSFWCLGNADSIIKAAVHVKLFVQFPEQQPNWELVMESHSFETVRIYTCQVFVFCLHRRLDGNLHYFYITCRRVWSCREEQRRMEEFVMQHIDRVRWCLCVVLL